MKLEISAPSWKSYFYKAATLKITQMSNIRGCLIKEHILTLILQIVHSLFRLKKATAT